MEEKAGITEYLCKLEPIEGILKYRYSDFVVNEINKEDEVVKLTNIDCPVGLKEEKKAVEMGDCDVTVEQLEALKNLKKSESVDIPIQEMDKSKRTKIHQFIKATLPHLSSSTMKNDLDINVIRVKYAAAQRRDSVMGSKEYCLFTMFKQNKSTMEAIESLCRLLRVKTATFSFAGTKDRRAVTSQQVAAFRIEPKRLFHLNKVLKNIVLGNFKITQTPLKLGDLNGNAFKIIVRKVTKTKDEVDTLLEQVRQRGFINYFGTQRFGTTEVCNSEVGRCIVKSDWMGAIDLIMKPRSEENEKLSACRKCWHEHKDASSALEALAGFSCVERKLLEGLVRYSVKNAVAALSMIPRNMRLMYLHAYQSVVWNRVASRRVRSHDLRVLPGDLYLKDGQDVQVVTEENVGEVCIEDVAIPMPGHDVKMPDNEVKGWIEEVLKEDQLLFSSFKHNIRDYCLSGGYRKLIVKPRCLQWQLLEYKEEKEQLLTSDLDALNPVSSPAIEAILPLSTDKETPQQPLTDAQQQLPQQPAQQQPPTGATKAPPQAPPQQPRETTLKALKLEFSLPSSTYATMLIREITKQDTSSSHQTTLN